MPDTLRERREAVVAAHVDAENRHDVEATIATFDHPRYEVIPFGSDHDGPDAVRELLGDLMTSFPDFAVETRHLHHADSAVIVEGVMTGTQRSAWAGIPTTNRAMRLPFVGVFDFEEDRLVCERVYFDTGTLQRQLGVA